MLFKKLHFQQLHISTYKYNKILNRFDKKENIQIGGIEWNRKAKK